MLVCCPDEGRSGGIAIVNSLTEIDFFDGRWKPSLHVAVVISQARVCHTEMDRLRFIYSSELIAWKVSNSEASFLDVLSWSLGAICCDVGMYVVKVKMCK